MDHNITVPYVPGYDLGLGVDSLSLDAKGLAVEGAATTPAGAAGSSSSFVMQRVESTSQLMSSLGVDVDVSVGSALFGAGAADRFSFAKNQQVQSSSLFMTVTASVTPAALSIDSPRLTSDAQADIGQAQAFHDRFGDSFIKTLQRGGLFCGVIRIDTSSEEDAQSLSNQFSGTYGLVASADVGVKLSNAAMQTHSQVSVDLFSIGGPVLKKPADPNALITSVNTFLDAFGTPESTSSNAKPIAVTLAPMQDALGPLPPNAVDIQHAQDVLAYCAKQRFTLLDNLNLVDQYATHPDRFVFPPGFQHADAVKCINGFQADLDLIRACASAALNSPQNAKFPADFASANGTSYPQGAMPASLPTLTVPNVTVPDFVHVPTDDPAYPDHEGDIHLAEQLAQQVGLTLTPVPEPGVSLDDCETVISQVPDPGTQVPRGSAVQVTLRP